MADRGRCIFCMLFSSLLSLISIFMTFVLLWLVDYQNLFQMKLSFSRWENNVVTKYKFLVNEKKAIIVYNFNVNAYLFFFFKCIISIPVIKKITCKICNVHDRPFVHFLFTIQNKSLLCVLNVKLDTAVTVKCRTAIKVLLCVLNVKLDPALTEM
jgi:hypothetical protein